MHLLLSPGRLFASIHTRSSEANDERNSGKRTGHCGSGEPPPATACHPEGLRSRNANPIDRSAFCSISVCISLSNLRKYL